MHLRLPEFGSSDPSGGDVLHGCQMSDTPTIRLSQELPEWLKETFRETGIPIGRLVREQMENAKASRTRQRFLRHLGAISGGSPDASSAKGSGANERHCGYQVSL